MSLLLSIGFGVQLALDPFVLYGELDFLILRICSIIIGTQRSWDFSSFTSMILSYLLVECNFLDL